MHEAAMIRAFMAGLIARAGGVEAAAALIGARLGHEISKGSISKRQAGQLDWPLVEIIALEDAVGARPVRSWIARNLPELAEGHDLMRGLASVSKESGEAMSAVMRMLAGEGDRARARAEVQEALDALRVLAAGLEAGEGA